MPFDFRQLDIWNEGIKFCKAIYEIVKTFPQFEEKNMVSQLRRASVSISTNVAEGCGKFAVRDEMSYYRIAQGSTKECMSLILLSKELGYLDEETCKRLYEHGEYISKMLTMILRKKAEKYRNIRNGVFRK